MSDEPTLEPTDAVPPPEPAVATEPAADVETAVVDAETPDADPPAADVPVGDTPPVEASKKKWYVVKVASGREESIKAAIERMVKIEGLEEFFGQIVIPVERITEVKKVTETKNGQKVTKEKRVVKAKKKFPGYLMAEVEWTPDLQALFRDTSGVGDFVGSTGPGKEPAPMSERDVQSMLYGMQGDDDGKGGQKPAKPIKLKLDYEVGDKVRIREGAFANYEGEVKQIIDSKEAGETPKVTVEVQVLGRPVPIELEYWQVDKI
jgi:transcriptional antiterminator NusG